jgi:hypothetical protein
MDSRVEGLKAKLLKEGVCWVALEMSLCFRLSNDIGLV